MLTSCSFFQRLLSQGASRLIGLSSVLLLGTTVGTLGYVAPTLAAQRVILTYGPLQEPFSIKDMRVFAETGQLDSLRQRQLRLAGADPEVLRGFLNKKLRVDFLFLDRALNSLPGEFLLYQIGQVIHNRQRVAPIEALRSSLVLSARGDNYISMLRFLENYPLPEVYVDGAKLIQIGRKVGNTRQKVEDYLETMAAVVQQVLGDSLCSCESDGKEQPSTK
jgi:hypothetical protein